MDAAGGTPHDEQRVFLHGLLAAGSWRRMNLPAPIEADYQQYHYEVAVSHLRAYWPLVALAIVAVGGALFLLGLVPAPLHGLVALGVAIYFVLAMGASVLARLSMGVDGIRWLLGLAATLGLLGMQLATVVVLATDDMGGIPQVGLVLVTVGVFSISNLLLRPALACVLSANLLFVLLMQVGDVPFEWPPFAMYSFGAALLGFIIGFSQEIRERTMFLQGRLLLLEKRATDEMAEELAQLSRTDALTGLVNRRHFSEILRREWATALRDGEPLGLLFIDVDHFKAYNDRYGHPAGDACLQQVSAVLALHAPRAADVMARFGGEEFVGLFPRTSVDGLAVIAARIVAAVDALGIGHEGAPGTGRVTVSIGVAARPPVAGEQPETLLQEADDALYRAKQAGRRGYVIAGR